MALIHAYAEREADGRDRRGEATRDGVLGAAIALFSEHGFEGTTMRDIADRVGVGTPLIVYHFETKEKLWRAAVDEVWRRMEASLVSHVEASGVALGDLDSGSDLHATLRAVLRAFAHSAALHPEYLRILLREGSHRGPRFDWLVRHHTRRNYRAGAALFEQAQAQGLLPAVPIHHLLYILAGALTFALAIAPDVEATTGFDPRSPSFLDGHIDALLALLTPASKRPDSSRPRASKPG